MSATKRLRGQAAIDAFVEFELGLARALGTADRLAFYEKLVPLQRIVVEASQAIVAGEWHQKHAGRGERWSDTYRLRKDQDALAVSEAVIEALRAL